MKSWPTSTGIIGHETHTCQAKVFFIRNPFGHEFISSGPWLRVENYTTPSKLFHKPNRLAQPVSPNEASPDATEPQAALLAHHATSAS